MNLIMKFNYDRADIYELLLLRGEMSLNGLINALPKKPGYHQMASILWRMKKCGYIKKRYEGKQPKRTLYISLAKVGEEKARYIMERRRKNWNPSY